MLSFYASGQEKQLQSYRAPLEHKHQIVFATTTRAADGRTLWMNVSDWYKTNTCLDLSRSLLWMTALQGSRWTERPEIPFHQPRSKESRLRVTQEVWICWISAREAIQ